MSLAAVMLSVVLHCVRWLGFRLAVHCLQPREAFPHEDWHIGGLAARFPSFTVLAFWLVLDSSSQISVRKNTKMEHAFVNVLGI